VRKHNFPAYLLSYPIHVWNIDNMVNKVGLIYFGLDTNLMGRIHTECVHHFITNLGKNDIFLGKNWLKYHNPFIW
ncbi:hypothetical protein HETIRDRAFT_46477, partial [Heterobasidion irregulare TC 32-1]